MIVLSGRDDVSSTFAESLAKELNSSHLQIQEKVFPDGEIYVRLPSEVLQDKVVVFVQSFIPPQDTSIFKTLLVIDILKEKGIKEVLLVIPYLAYSRQDREFLPNEAVSIRTLLKTLKLLGASKLFTVEIHKKDSLKFFGDGAYSISPFKYIAKKIGFSSDVLVLAPDLGALERAREFADAIGAKYDYLIKERDRITGEITIKPKSLDVKGREVIIVDDIISTGGTVAKASRLLYDQGATSVTVIVAHALMVGNALERLREAGVKKVIACNTLPKKNDPLIEYIDVSPLVAEKIKETL
jgi:ribose-phosphate pyrophosphokinase